MCTLKVISLSNIDGCSLNQTAILDTFVHFLECSVSFRRAWDNNIHTKSTHQIRTHVLLISKLHQMIAVALCSHVSACNLNRLAQIPLQLYWSPVIISCFGTELDSWGCCRCVTLWVGVIMGNELQALVTGFFITAVHYQVEHLAQISTKHITWAGSSWASMIKRASEVNKGGCSC